MSRIRFSSLKGRPLRGSSGNALGKIADCVVRLVDGAQPQVIGVLLRLGGRDLFVSMSDVAEVREDGIQLASNRLDTRPFDRRPGEVLLARDVVNRAVIDVVEARLIRVGDLILEGEGATWRIAAVIPSVASSPVRALRHLLRRETPLEEVPWTRIEPLTSHVPSARRQLPFLRLAGLRPADIADIVEEASHEEGQEILDAVRQDEELEADVFEELNEEHQVEFIKDRSDAEAAALLAEMEPDDAADLLMNLDPERRPRVLEQMPAPAREQLRGLLGFHPNTAGGLMSTEYVALPEEATVQRAIDAIRGLEEVPDTLAVVFALDGERLSGAVTLARLLQAEPDEALGRLGDRNPVAVFPDADLPSIAVEMADYNLAELPVVDEGGRLLGIVSYDDLIEAMVPDEWRWRSRASQDYRYEPAPDQAGRAGTS
jgi:CBS domain-containing protein